MNLVLAPADRRTLERLLLLNTLSQAIAKIARLTLQTKPPAPLTHWLSRRLAAKFGVAHTTVTTVWKRHRLKPHRWERYKGSPDRGNLSALCVALPQRYPSHTCYT